jgi:hypothetical protein
VNKQSGLLLCLFISVFLLSSCSSLNFVAEGNTPFKISAQSSSDQTVEAEGSADFYFWGQSPGVMKIDLEDIETKFGMTRPSFISVEQTFSAKSLFFTVITFGLYCPVDYTVKMLKVTKPEEKSGVEHQVRK